RAKPEIEFEGVPFPASQNAAQCRDGTVEESARAISRPRSGSCPVVVHDHDLEIRREAQFPTPELAEGAEDRRRYSVHVALEVPCCGFLESQLVSSAEQHLGHRGKLSGELLLPSAQPQNRSQVGAEDLTIPEPSEGNATALG